MDKVAGLPCALHYALGQDCYTPMEIHHIRVGQGMGRRASNFLVVPICVEAHRGPQGIHGDRTLWKIAGMSELDALSWTIEMLGRGR